MINTTSSPILITREIREIVQNVLLSYRDFLVKTIGPQKDADRYYRWHYVGFDVLDPDHLPCRIDEEFFAALNNFCIEPSRFYGERDTLDRMYDAAQSSIRLAASRFKFLRRLVRYLLCKMAAEGHLLLPITFTIHNAFDRDTLISLSSELGRFCYSFPKTGSEGSTYIRMTGHVPQWLRCTDWLTPEAVNIDEAVELNRFLNACKNGNAGFPVPTVAPSVRMFLVELHKAFPTRVNYEQNDIKKFDLLFAKRLHGKTTPVRISCCLAEKAQLDQQTNSRQTDDHESKVENNHALTVNKVDDFSMEDAKNLIYVRKYDRIGWFPDIKDHSFISLGLPQQAITLWSNLFEQYIDYRINVKGFESTKGTRKALFLLADYMAICLPVIYHVAERERSGRSQGVSKLKDDNLSGKFVIMPCSPKEFTRFPFIDSRGDVNVLAPTLPNYIKLRYSSKNSRYAHLNQIFLFFRYIEQNYSDKASVDFAGPQYRNPISKDFDLPRLPGRGTKTTNKLPFSKHVLPHLVCWFYAIEAFGIYLQETTQAAPCNKRVLQTEDYGYVPFYRLFDKVYPITNILCRLVSSARGSDYPSLSYLRMFITSLESGARLQGSQWLCRLTFDKLNEGRGGDDIFHLWINTDKTNNGYSTPILKRVREMLLREKHDQNLHSPDAQKIFYENRPYTRFEKLVPLFGNPATGRPYSDSAYDEVWAQSLENFQYFYALHVGFVPFTRVKKPAKVELKYTSEKHPYCPTGRSALYTPHSCRSTFITRRAPFISLEDLAGAVGHADEKVTSIYVFPEQDELAGKLAYADRALMTGQPVPAPISSGPALIKASEQNSALQVAFRADRANTIRHFGIISLRRALDNADETSAIAILKASPLSQIVFRDTHICPVGEHCPEEVIRAIGEGRRCGLCQLACKSFDHLTAIAAKVRFFDERIRIHKATQQRFLKNKASDGDLAEIYDMIDADVQEMLAWKLTEDILWDIKNQYPESYRDHIHVTQPDLVRQHLRRIVRPCSEQEWLLRRIIEANTYPTMSTDWLRLQANKLKRRILADVGPVSGLVDIDDDTVDDVEVLASFVTTVMRAKNRGLESLAEALRNPMARIRNSPFLLELNAGNASNAGT